jgi:hypothetical protein
VKRGYRGRHRASDTPHRLEYWQRHCLWHASCSCGGYGLGGDGAEAMANVKHNGPGAPSRPLMGYCVTGSKL